MQTLRELAATFVPRLLGSRLSPAGLCIAGDRLSAAQLQQTPSGPRLYAAGSLDLGGPWHALLAEPRRFRRTLAQLWKAQGFSGSDVIAAMPPERLRVFTMDYTPAAAQSDAEAIASELKDRLKGKSLLVDFVPVRAAAPDERSREAVVAAAAREDVTAFLDLLTQAQMNVRALDISGMALKRIVPWTAKATGRDTGMVLLIDIGWTSSELMIVSGRRLMLDRSIEFGEQRLVSRVARLLELPEDTVKRLMAEHAFRGREGPQAAEFEVALREILGAELATLKSEVTQTLDYAASKTRGSGVDKVLIVGALAGFPGVVDFLGRALGKPVELLDPLAVFPHDLDPDDVRRLSQHYGLAVAIGLALRGVPES